MPFRRIDLIPVITCLVVALGSGPMPAAGEQEPVPRLEAGGPSSPVQALVFSPDGKTLYEAGFDKVVRAWSRDAATGRLVLEPRAFRVPIGPGFDGAINALAVSAAGDWLAAGGLGAVRGRAGFQQIGVVASSRGMSVTMREDEGTIVLFHTRRLEQRRLRGHRGAILALAFAPAQAGKPLQLVSAAREPLPDGSERAVLRLWDCDGQKELARASFRPDFRIRQELTVRHTGPAPRQVSVTVVWGDACVRVWDATAEEVQVQPSGYALAAATLPGREAVVLATHGEKGGQLEVWTSTGDRRTIALPPGHFPLVVRPLPDPKQGQPDRVAVVARVPAQEDAYLLHFVELAPGSPTPIHATIPLWKRANRLPALAVTADGQAAAVAGAPDQSVRIFGRANLKPGEMPAPQLLRSPGQQFASVAFASSGAARGLILSTEPRRKPGEPPSALTERDLLFDVSRREFIRERAGWKPDVLPQAGWSLTPQTTPVPEQRVLTWTARVLQNGVAQGSGVKLEGVRAVTDFALRPPDGLIKVPLLAVAFLDEVGQPLLALYNAASGEQVRQLTSHLGAIRCLAFSGDGRLLVSSGDDQTVCVWSLTSLPNHLGRRGALPDVPVREEGGKLLVAEVTGPRPAEGKVRPGQLIEGFVEKGKLQPVTSRATFHDQLLLRRPGEPLTLRLGQGGGDVQVRVGQAIDEWKPLFSLFVAAGTAAGRIEWIGWNPTGPYDASNRDAERFLGWHFNPAKQESPVTFAAAAQYREQRHRPGILKHLVAEGSLSGALAAWDKEERARKLPEAKLRLWLDDDVGLDRRKADGQGRFLLQKRPGTLNLVVDDLPLDRMGSVVWQVEGLTPAPASFADPGRRMLSAVVDSLAWARGTYRVRVVLRTNDDEPREFAQELQVRYQPPPPAITGTLPEGQKVSDATPAAQRRLEVMKPEFRVQAVVTPGSAGQKVTVRVRHQHQGKDLISKELAADKPQTVAEAVQLREGDNLLEVLAINQGAPADQREAESARLSLVVRFTRPVPDPAPVVVLDTLASGDERLPLEAGRVVTVRTPQVRLLGSITSAKNLVEAELTLAEGKPRRLDKFAADRHAQWSIQEDLRLVPGRQKVLLTARTATSERTRVLAEVEYRPVLPEVSLEEPDRLELYAGYDPAELSVKGRFTAAADPQPFTAVLLVDGQERQKIEAAGAWTVKLTLTPGVHRVQVRLSNAWGAESTSEALQLRYLRPPRFLKVEGAVKTDKPVSDRLTALVHSPLELDRTAVEVEVNEQRTVTAVALTKKADGTWEAALSEVSLHEGSNTVRLWLRNAEARSREPATWTIHYTLPPKPPPVPEIVLLEPARDVSWTARVLPVRFRVQSAGPLRSVVLTREGRPPLRQVFDTSRLPHGERGTELHLRLNLTPVAQPAASTLLDIARVLPDAAGLREVPLAWVLLPGVNRFRLEAVNEGGAVSAEWVVDYHYQPVRFSLTRLLPRTGAEAVELPADLRDVPALADSRSMLEGFLTWDEDRADLFAPGSEVRVRVNGLRLPAARLSVARAKERRLNFEVPMVLPRMKNNHVEVEIAGVKVDGPRRREFRVDCLKAAKQPQRLHMLLIQHGEQPPAELQRRVLEALQPDPDCELVVHGPFTGTVRPGQVLYELQRIKVQIDLRIQQGLINNLLVVYYEGAESVSELGHFFPASLKATEADLRRRSLTCDSMAEYMAEMAGAQVLLLDVARPTEKQPLPGEDRVVNWPQEIRPGVLRYRIAAVEELPPSRTLLMRDLAKVTPVAADLQGVASRIQQNFREVLLEQPADAPRASFEGIVRGHKPLNLPGVLYDWHYPVSYATLRVGRSP